LVVLSNASAKLKEALLLLAKALEEAAALEEALTLLPAGEEAALLPQEPSKKTDETRRSNGNVFCFINYPL
jgi:hypothetical protein